MHGLLAIRLAPFLCAASICACCPTTPDPRSLPSCDQPPQADVTAAKGAHEAATRLFERGEHAHAIRIWIAAYRLDCSAHGLLVNIGLAYEKLAQPSNALDAYTTYVERTGSDADPEIVAKVQALQ